MSINQMVATNIQSIATNGLVAYFDAGLSASYTANSSTWTDTVGSDNNATLVNSPTYSSNNNGYYTFNGTNQYATVNGSPINVTNYTKCVWVYFNASADNNILSYDDNNATGHYMYTGGTSSLYNGHTSWSGFPTTYSSATTFNNSTWYNIVVTFNTTDGMTLYVNGTLDSTYTAQKTAPVGAGLNIGCYAVAGNLLNGRIAQVLIYNRTLTAAEVRQNFAATRGRFRI